MFKRLALLAVCFAVLFSFPVSAAESDEYLVPLRNTAESYGAAVEWNEAERSATVTFGGTAATVSADGGEAEIKDNVMLVPFEFITGLTQSGVPTIKSVELLDKDGAPLPVTAGWVNLQKDNIISVTFGGEATHVDFFTVPTGTETFLEQRIIGRAEVEGNENNVRFEWEAPGSFLGYIWVVVYNGDVARTSDMGEFFIKAIYDRA